MREWEFLRKLDKKSLKRDRLLKGKEAFKIYHEVFDRTTLFALYKLLNRKVLDEVTGIISTGKEANVFHGLNAAGEGFAIKIYRIATSDFKRKASYLISDPRFSQIKRDSRSIVFSWAQREFRNLKILEGVINSPKPFAVEKNVLIMEFLGEKGLPYPTLKDVGPLNPEKDFEDVLQTMKKMYERELIHADLSEFNILRGKNLYYIDFAQATLISNQNSKGYLLRDVKNVRRYFSRYLKVPETQEVLKIVKGEE